MQLVGKLRVAPDDERPQTKQLQFLGALAAAAQNAADIPSARRAVVCWKFSE